MSRTDWGKVVKILVFKYAVIDNHVCDHNNHRGQN